MPVPPMPTMKTFCVAETVPSAALGARVGGTGNVRFALPLELSVFDPVFRAAFRAALRAALRAAFRAALRLLRGEVSMVTNDGQSPSRQL